MQKSWSNNQTTPFIIRGASIVAMAAALSIALPMTFPAETGSVAFAQQGGHGGGSSGGGHSDGDSGHSDSDSGHDDTEGHTDSGDDAEGHSGGKGKGGKGKGGTVGKGQGGPGATSDGKGPRAGSSGGSQGGRPAWAKEGIPDVELGRLNVSRSPSRILEKAAAEEVSNLTPETVAFYSMPLDAMITALKTDFDNVSMIDSPVANLGLLKDVLDGQSVLSAKGVTSSPEVLAAVFLGTASDKTIEISPETAYAVSTILGYELSEAQSQALAKDAEDIRAAILEGHG
jgi:hypothetical protein